MILQIYRLAHTALQGKVIKTKATVGWLPPEDEVEDLVEKYEVRHMKVFFFDYFFSNIRLYA